MTTLLMATADRPRAQGSFAPSFPNISTERERYAWITREFSARTAAQPSANRARTARDVAALAFGVTLLDLQSVSRKSELVTQRYKIACVIHVLTGVTLAPIARLICRDRSTVLYGMRKFGAEVRTFLTREAR